MTGKYKKMWKRFCCLVFAFLLSVNSFGAIVSDNDKSAFMPKSEFDSIKNTFQSQIDAYYTSADSKIDNAISSYIAGITTSKTEEVGLPLRNWEKVTMVNGIIKPQFTYPSINVNALLQGGYGSYSGQTYQDNTWFNEYWAYANAVLNQDQTKTSIRPTVTNIKEDGSDDSRMTWNGVKNKWIDSINATIAFWSVDNLYALEVSGYTNRFFVYQLACFSGNGYNANLSDNATDYWKVGYGYYSNYGGYGYKKFDSRGGIFNKSLVFGVSYDDVIYKHVCNWNNSFSNWEVYNETFLHTMKNSAYDTLKANDWYTSMTKIGKWYGEKFPLSTDTWQNRIKNKWKDLSMSNNTYNQATTNYYIPRIGLYDLSVAPASIYQTQTKYKQVVDNDKVELPILNLIQGLPLFYAKVDDVIEWSPEFINLSSSEVGLITGSEEICLMLSTVPFNDGATTEGIGDKDLIAVRNFGSDEETKYPKSVNKKMRLKFKMPKDGFVYAKWYPVFATESYKDTKVWQVDLDLANCGSYVRHIANK